MKNLKKTLALLLVSSSLSMAGTFEQNGVKEGNNRVSIGLSSTLHDNSGAEANGYIYGQYGRFLNNDVEVYLDAFISKGGTKGTDNVIKNSVSYMVGPGVNYYFLKSPTLTPYIGIQFFYSDAITDAKGDFSANGSKYYIAAHKFLSENTSISPEMGVFLYDFVDYANTYFNIYLTYFFD